MPFGWSACFLAGAEKTAEGKRKGKESMGTLDIILTAAIACALGLAVRSIIRSRKSGKCTCGCEGCSGCAAKRKS